jgi:hypothetical protein
LQQPDKRKHFAIGFAISLIIGVFIPWLGLIAACIAGGIKEWWDFVFTCLGALSAYPFALLVHLIW